MSETNKQIALKFIDAMGRGDVDTAATCITDTTFTLAKGFGKFAGVRTYETILATIAVFKQLMPAGMKPEIISATADEDRVAVEFAGHGQLLNGDDYSNEYCMVFYFESGKIIKVHEYFCTIHADEKLWPLVKDMTL